ncbi:MAG: hypothetical protein HOQ12_09595, partial [Gemmatimonadaceae bacterium]|nr:hypothetical protein [Gemmatimonadaceae bacterium]
MFARSTAVALAAALAGSVGCTTARAQQPAPAPVVAAPSAAVAQVITNGQGEAKIVPDRARREVSVQTR